MLTYCEIKDEVSVPMLTPLKKAGSVFFFFYMCYYTIMPDSSTTCYSNTSTRTLLLNREFFFFQVNPPLKDQGLKEIEKKYIYKNFSHQNPKHFACQDCYGYFKRQKSETQTTQKNKRAQTVELNRQLLLRGRFSRHIRTS